MCVSNNKRDFPEGIQPITNAKADRIASHLKLEGIGNICWSLLDTVGNICGIVLPAFSACKALQRLLSMSEFCKHYPKNAVILNPKLQTIQPNPDQPEQNLIDISIDPNNDRFKSLHQLAVHFSKYVTTMQASNFNLSKPHKNFFDGTIIWVTLVCT